MSQLKRRHFLQFAGSTLATLGLSQFDFFQQAERYGRVLAQTTPRKLALLVGINNYQGAKSLKGCLTDVELQKHLLIYRFGFNPSDIIIISDNSHLKPTRENIIQAFQEHLIKQAKADDVVVFHYSGHGSLIKDPFPLDLKECRAENRPYNSCLYNGTIVPQNATPLGQQGEAVTVSDIMGQTLFLLMSRLQTDKLTTILDSCHSGAGTRGNAVVRAARLTRSGEELIASEIELELQEQLLAELGWGKEEFQRKRTSGIAKGVALGSAGRTQEAIDAQFDGFHAGAFTYLLTRYLWQLTSTQSVESTYINLRRSTRSLAESKQSRTAQIPILEYQPGSNFNQKPLFFLNLTTPSAEAVITKIRGETIEFWLGGVASQNLTGSEKEGVFSVLNESGNIVGEIQQTSRVEGLFGIGKQISGDASAIKEGRLLREKIVGIPKNPKLKLALDESLGADLKTAQAELESNQWVELVPATQLDNSGYFLGRFTESYKQQQTPRNLEIELPSVNSVGLFQPDLTPEPQSFVRLNERIVDAINRLEPTFKRLLANQILGQLLNVSQGSPLQVQAEVFGGVNAIKVASRGAESGNPTANLLQVPSRTNLQVKVENFENQDLYLGVLVISATGSINILYPADWEAPEEASRIDRNGSLTVPRPREGNFQVRGESGRAPELLLLVSQEPLRQALKAMQTIARSRGMSRGFITGLTDNEPTDLINGLLEDLTGFSRSGQPDRNIASTQGSIPYETSKMVVLSAVIEIVN
ncbi:caspase family protein [Limnoraphis robusta]|uniref:Caspase family protein n=1 Tax=Limnoraphis robusta CCNP1315 TaxID=3110306 RepID=A0ABU5TQZ4_9CYAN|nr:caspase family protein [Limnoraphis robusta]MEA5497560.1 caspase family protein [Limnoraphis robusta BA-68 BA1]MEA5517343.1 caspase family protein [Limnoraphis robusta CCNP1315]MEA5546068.1 caspase family protein [Limnoraphis robusta CCNP1324]